MIVSANEQGSKDWLAERVGILSASGVKSLMTKTGKQSKGDGARTLVYEKVGETLIGEPLKEVSGDWMERGTELEPEARAWLSMELNEDIEQVGFALYDGPGILNKRVGASLDGIIHPVAFCEFKCPSAHVAIRYLCNPNALVETYKSQVQTQFLVSGLEECHMVSYCPGLPTVHEVVYPDAAYQDELIAALEWAVTEIDAGVAKLRDRMPVVDWSDPFS